MDSDAEILRHYDRPGLYEKILALLDSGGMQSLRALDEFHIGGHRATGLFLSQLGLKPGMSVLDIGSGLGGPARAAAGEYGATVTGVDLTASYADAATRLSALTGHDNRTIFHCASALALPFPDESFDAGYTIHTAMNIADKPLFLHEAQRVLKPGAIFGLYDVLRAKADVSRSYPMPWADEAEQSFLASPDDYAGLLESAGFAIVSSTDTTPASVEALERHAALKDSPGLHLLLGENFKDKTANLLSALRSGACASYMIVTRRI